MAFEITSTAFQANGMIPSKYTCDGEDLSPPLAWQGAPSGTKSFALIADDPDAPGKTWVHWVLYNLPSTTTGLPENVPKKEALQDGSRQGMTDFDAVGYGGPCPPSGVHRYYFKLYALDTTLSFPKPPTKVQLLDAMKGRVLGESQLMGRYTRRR
ncbi:MAG: YbhB/YbcL family Raf kinase inhibitor-like protein [Candidatus Omnitrophica bacterium]|nr:YbhB/YbcL family Raf kinase inhibitor-like protein [Candidatus Omnitrophota bacterium]